MRAGLIGNKINLFRGNALNTYRVFGTSAILFPERN
jgi:hypothetical protein